MKHEASACKASDEGHHVQALPRLLTVSNAPAIGEQGTWQPPCCTSRQTSVYTSRRGRQGSLWDHRE